MIKETLECIKVINNREIAVSLHLEPDFRYCGYNIQLSKDIREYLTEEDFKELHNYICDSIISQANELRNQGEPIKGYFTNMVFEGERLKEVISSYKISYEINRLLIYNMGGYGRTCDFGVDGYGNIYVNEDDGCWSVLDCTEDWLAKGQEYACERIAHSSKLFRGFEYDTETIEVLVDKVFKGLHNLANIDNPEKYIKGKLVPNPKSITNMNLF